MTENTDIKIPGDQIKLINISKLKQQLIYLFKNNEVNNIKPRNLSNNMIYLLSHFVAATLFVVLLKNRDSITLAIILTCMLGYLCYDNSNYFSKWLLPVMGTVMYVIDYAFVTTKCGNKKLSHISKIKKTIWKLPYYAIVSYYCVHYMSHTR